MMGIRHRLFLMGAVGLGVLGLQPVPCAARAPTDAAEVPHWHPDDVVTTQPLGPEGGTIDWTHRVIRARGHGAPPVHAFVPDKSLPYAQRRAEGMAQQRLDNLVRALLLAPPNDVSGAGLQTMADHLRAHPELELLLHDSLSQMYATTSVYRADGEVELEVALNLDGGDKSLGALWAMLWRALGGTRQSARAQPALGPTTSMSRRPTGIVIIAHQTGFVPGLWPRITDSRGAVLYGPERVHPDILQIRGVLGMTRSLEAARRDARVAGYPWVMTAARGDASDTITLILNDDDAQKLQDGAQLLDEARVMLVLDG
jgi:hypothetical protein